MGNLCCGSPTEGLDSQGRPLKEQMQWALVCVEEGQLQLQQVPIPKPGPGQVLIKVMATPLNPSDISKLKGNHTRFQLQEPNYPSVVGTEGAGIVVANGGGIIAKAKQGKQVAFITNSMFAKYGAYQQYTVAEATGCLNLPATVDCKAGSMTFVNPLTAQALIDLA